MFYANMLISIRSKAKVIIWIKGKRLATVFRSVEEKQNKTANRVRIKSMNM